MTPPPPPTGPGSRAILRGIVGCQSWLSLKEDIPLSVNGHLYQSAYHEACSDPLTQGWKWYCVYIHAGSWQPAPVMRPGDWRKGDNRFPRGESRSRQQMMKTKKRSSGF